MVVSLGFGVINFLFVILVFYIIDMYGWCNLLFIIFLLMVLFMFFIGFSFWILEDSLVYIGCIVLGIYFFGIVYSFGEGLVLFIYLVEVYLLYICVIGMSFVMVMMWFFNFVLVFMWLSLLEVFRL